MSETMIYLLLLFEGYTDVTMLGPCDVDVYCQTTPIAFNAYTSDGIHVAGVVCCNEKCVIDTNYD